MVRYRPAAGRDRGPLQTARDLLARRQWARPETTAHLVDVFAAELLDAAAERIDAAKGAGDPVTTLRRWADSIRRKGLERDDQG